MQHVGLIYAINVQRTTRRNFMFYCRVNLCKFPEIQQSVIRKDVTYPISVVSIVTLDTRFSYFLLFKYFYAYQRPHFTRVFTCFFYRARGSRSSHKFCRLRPYDVLVRIKFSNESVTCNSVCESTVAVKIRLKRSSFAFH